MRSLERDLLRWIVGALAVGTLLLTLVAYWVTLEEMNEVFDAELKTVAEGVASIYRDGHESSTPSGPASRQDEPEDIEIVTLSWSADGQRLYSSDPRVDVPFTAVEGHSEPVVGGERWIVHTVVRHGFVAQAAHRQSQRRQMAGESAAQISSLMVGLVAGVGVLLVFCLRRGRAPLDVAARDIATRSAGALAPIPADSVPRELMPVLDSTNALLRRLGTAFAAQRRFLADAAHELRTPITALRLQLQLLQRSPNDAARRAAMEQLEAGIDRAQHLVEQLLQVARSEPDVEALRLEAVDLGELARGIVGRFSARADERGVDLGAHAADGVVVEGDVQQLTVLLNNLVGNALHYAPGGPVDVVVERVGGRAVLRVVDAGPGIPVHERERVFDRFYRGEATRGESGGSGLGLAIVRAVAEQHGAHVELGEGRDGRGLSVSVTFA